MHTRPCNNQWGTAMFPNCLKREIDQKVRLVSTLFQEKALNQYIPRNASVSACKRFTREASVYHCCLLGLALTVSARRSFSLLAEWEWEHFLTNCWTKQLKSNSAEAVAFTSKHNKMWNIIEWGIKLNVPLGGALRLCHFLLTVSPARRRAKKCIIISTYIHLLLCR